MAEMRYCPRCARELVEATVGGKERLVCGSADCDFVFWDNPVPVVAAIAEVEGGVVLVRNRGWPEKWLGLVTGFLERDEAPEAAVLRELVEELGLEGEVVSLVGLYPFRQMNQLIIAYHVRARGEIRLGSELERYKVIPVERLKPWSFGTGPAVRDWLRARPESDA